MMVEIEIAGVRATIENYQWSSDNKQLQTMLNAMLDPLGPSGADPYPDLTAATEAVERLGGKIIEADEPKGTSEAVGQKAADEPPPNVRGKPLPKEEATEGWEVTEEDMEAAQAWVDRAMKEAGLRD